MPQLHTPPARTLRVPGDWVSKSNTYTIRGQGLGLARSARTRCWEEQAYALAAAHTPLDGPLVAAIVTRASSRRLDAHNVHKALLDAAESRRRDRGQRTITDTGRGLYRNDRQVGPVGLLPLPPGPPFVWLAVWPDTGDTGAMLAAWGEWFAHVQEVIRAEDAAHDRGTPRRPRRDRRKRAAALGPR